LFRLDLFSACRTKNKPGPSSSNLLIEQCVEDILPFRVLQNVDGQTCDRGCSTLSLPEIEAKGQMQFSARNKMGTFKQMRHNTYDNLQ